MKNLLPLLLLLSCSLSLSAQWQYLPGPDGGNVFNLETDENTLYALTQTGIYQSNDEGYHWKLMPGSREASQNISKLTVENGVFYGISIARKLLRSTDGGQSWQTVLQDPFPGSVSEEYLRGLQVQGDTVLVNGNSTIYRSVDRGESWVVSTGVLEMSFPKNFSTGRDFFSWGNGRIYRSSDGGLHWERILSFANNIIMACAVGNTQYILYNNQKLLAKSTDGFRTWEYIETDVFLSTFGDFHYPLKLVGKGDTLYCVGKTSSAGCASRFCYSTDKGDTWQAGNNGKPLPVTIDDVILFDRHLVFNNEQAGISHSTDGFQTFTTEQSGLTATFVDDVATQGKTVFTSGNQTVYYSKNDGRDWEETAPNLETTPCEKHCWMFSTQKRLYLIKKYGVKFYSEDEGISWEPLDLESFYPRGTTQNCIWGSDLLNLHRISDDGIISTIDLTTHLDGQAITSLVTAANHVIAVSTGPYLILDEKGQLLRKIPAAPCEPLFFVGPKEIHFDGRHLFYFCTNDTYVFAEGASEWQKIYPQDWTTGIPLYHSPMTYIVTYKGVTFVALEGKGIFYTTDATGRFYPLDPPLPELHTWKISFKDNSMWVSSDVGGVYTLDLPLLQSAASEKPVFQHSPNPSDGHLRIQSDVFFTDEIQLDILDMSGRLAISTLLRPGQSWDLDFPTLSKGLYVLRLRTALGNSSLKWCVMK